MQLHAGRRPTRLSACRQCLRTWLPTRTLSDFSLRGRPRTSSLPLFSSPSLLRTPRPRQASYLLNFEGQAAPSTPPPGLGKPIRQYLRDLEGEETAVFTGPLPRDAARAGATQNAMTRVESYDLAQLKPESSHIDGGDEGDPEVVKLWETNHESEDPLTPESMFARPYGTVSPKAGDLIEVSTDSWRLQMLAVCLGKFRGVDHYYTNTGKWFASTNVHTMFHVTNFATPAELASTIAGLPSLAKEAGDSSSSSTPEGAEEKKAEDSVSNIDKMLNTLQEMKKGPSREAGAGLLKKMQAFAHQSVGIHMAYASLLDNAYSIIRKAIFPPPPAKSEHAVEPVPVCWTKPFTKEESLKLYKQAYFSLDDLASILLRHQQSAFPGLQSLRANHRNYALRNFVDEAKARGMMAPDTFTAPAMYAIYRALVSDDVAFRPVSSRLGNPNEIHDTETVVTEDEHELPVRSRSCLFQVSPPEDVDMVNEVEQLVREFNDNADNIPDNGQVRDLGDTRHRLAAFVMNAREAIDHSRKTRYWSPYGMLLAKENKYNVAATKWASQDAKERRVAYSKGVRNRPPGPHQRLGDDSETAVHYPASPRLNLDRKQWNSQALPQSSAHNPLVRKWYPYDIMVLHFMHLWAGYKRFSPTSRLHWIGSSILRATQRYEGSEYLTMSTGWTFLQEVGYLKPWDVPARYSMSLPDVPPKRDGTLDRTSRLAEAFETAAAEVYKADDPADLLSGDLFEGKRTSWEHLTTYCVDSADTEDVDDGFSIEHVKNKTWVHVHIADPASCIRPGSKLAEMAKQMPQTSYLPGFTSPMFPESIVRERFSLGTGRPCLTFSAQLDKSGNVVKTQIAPGVLGRVVYMTPEDVSSLVSAEEQRTRESFAVPQVAQPRYADLPWTTASFAVGTPHSSQDLQLMAANRRQMLAPEDASYRVTKELKELMRFATILRQKRLEKGAMPMYWPSPQVKVHTTYTDTIQSQSLVPVEEYHGLRSLPPSIATWKGGRSATFFRCEGDPYIKIYYDGYDDPKAQPHAAILQGKGAGRVSGAGSRMVESIMRLAGETAAKWCAERNIAVPYRGQPAAIPHLERLEVLARKVIYPELLEGKRPPEDALVEFRRLLGSDEITAVPVPHVTMGAERYTKATSPLRRYSDLVVHWQIEHALRAEMNTQGNKIATTKRFTIRPQGYAGLDPDSQRKADQKRAAQRKQDASITGPCFTREDLERDILPLMRVRERAMRTLDNRMGRDQWMLQALVRAWKGAEYAEVIERPVFGTDRTSMRRARKLIKRAEKNLRKELGVKTKKIQTPYVPPALQKVAFRNLRFTVTGVNMRQGVVTGRLDWFERVALMEIAGLNPKNEDDDLTQAQDQDVDYHDDDVHETPDTKSMTPLALEDVQPGNVFPVALDFVDVHANRVVVRRTGDVCKPEANIPAPGPPTKADKMRAKRQKARALTLAKNEAEAAAIREAEAEREAAKKAASKADKEAKKI